MQTVRQSMTTLIRSAFHPVLLRFFVFAAAYATTGVWLLYRFGYWTPELLKTTILWFLGGSGIAAVMSTDKDGGYASFWKIIGRTIAFTALLEFVVNAYTFPLVVELLTLPIIFLVFGALTVSKTLPEFADRKYDATRKLLTWIMVAYGFSLIGYSLWSALTHLDKEVGVRFTKDFFLPLILALWFIPFIYAARLYAVVEQALIGPRLQLAGNAQLYAEARRSIVLSIGVNLKKAQFFRKQFSWSFYDVADGRALSAKLSAFNEAWSNGEAFKEEAGTQS